MNQTNLPPSLNAAMGIAGAVGCLMAVIALGSLLVGLGIDQLLGTNRRIAAIVCALGSLPFNLVFAVWITKRLIARYLTPEGAKKAPPPDKPTSE